MRGTLWVLLLVLQRLGRYRVCRVAGMVNVLIGAMTMTQRFLTDLLLVNRSTIRSSTCGLILLISDNPPIFLDFSGRGELLVEGRSRGAR